jgi:GNAT superfamily N-acetyltransferase
MGAVQFFRLAGRDWAGADRLEAMRAAEPELRASFWGPSFARPFPPGRLDPRILSYTLLHVGRQFKCRDYGMVALIDQQGHIAHSSMIMPSFARFPFMERRDLQIGATQTRAEYRGRGLAVWAIDEAVARFGDDRSYWYLTNAANAASIAVIRKAGFTFAGTGDKEPRLGLRSLGYYAISSPAPSPDSLQGEQR